MIDTEMTDTETTGTETTGIETIGTTSIRDSREVTETMVIIKVGTTITKTGGSQDKVTRLDGVEETGEYQGSIGLLI